MRFFAELMGDERLYPDSDLSRQLRRRSQHTGFVTRLTLIGGNTTQARVKHMRRILIVEDEERLRSAIVAYLKSQGAHPIASATAQEALSVLDTDDIDMIVLDLNLVSGDGLDVLRHIRGSSELADLPVLAMSAWDMEPASYDYLEPGDYLTKPFDMRLMDMVIRQFIELPRSQPMCASKAAVPEMPTSDVDGGL
jgi:DNA-binding response OmpR family regulator